MKRQGGFTLIELVVVIVILGILAVTAAPRFLNLQGDARSASLQGLQGAMKGAAGIVYGKSAIQGIEKSESGSISVDGKTVDVVYGYPAATTSGIGEAMELDTTTEWTLSADTTTTLVATFFSSSVSGATAIKNTNCYLTYTQAESSSAAPSVVLTKTGC
ncbi:type II secretion system GspH family protein [Vibrio fluvialis]|nr:type II secretion system GspH family protein [Vibrio fluvialis]MBY7920278.1 type II secretion system GspH family protein [Vibrio fluvialis]